MFDLLDYKTLSQLDNVSPAILQTSKNAQSRLPKLIAAEQQKEQAEVMGKLKDLGNTVLGQCRRSPPTSALCFGG